MMNTWRNTTALVTVAVIAATGAAAETAEVAALKARVVALETQFAARGADAPKLQFDVGQTKVTVYGFVRAEAFQDFDFAQGDTSFAGALREGNEVDGEFETSVRVSRFGIRSKTETAIGTIGTQLELDLFSGSGETTSPNPRLRHANVTINDNWLFGQFWTNFMPLNEYPNTADFNGPVGITFARVPQVRYSNQLGNGINYSFSIEESNASTPSNDPVITGAVGYGTDTWRARIAGLAGRVDDGAGDDLGYGAVTVSGAVTPWAGGAFTGTYTRGNAIASLLIGTGEDVVNGETNEAEGFTLEFRQQVSEKWNVGIAYGSEDLEFATNAASELGSQSVHVNAFYRPVDNLTFALEYIYTELEDGVGVKRDANRLGASVTFSF